MSSDVDQIRRLLTAHGAALLAFERGLYAHVDRPVRDVMECCGEDRWAEVERTLGRLLDAVRTPQQEYFDVTDEDRAKLRVLYEQRLCAPES